MNNDHMTSLQMSPRDRPLGRPVGEYKRSLTAHRLSETLKLVLRRSLRLGDVRGYYCEGCLDWFDKPVWPAIPEVIHCGGSGWRPGDRGCGRAYRLEAAFYEEVLPGEDYLAEQRGEDDGDVGPNYGAGAQDPADVEGEFAPAQGGAGGGAPEGEIPAEAPRGGRVEAAMAGAAAARLRAVCSRLAA